MNPSHPFSRRFAFQIIGLAALVACAPLSFSADAHVAGDWKSSFTTPNGNTIESKFKLKQDGEKISGVYLGRNGNENQIENGKIKDGQVSFSVTRERQGEKVTTKYSGKVQGDVIKGKIEFERNGETLSRDWEAKREKAAANLTGNWQWAITRDDGEKIQFTLKLKQEEGKISGISIGPNDLESPISDGKIQGDEISFRVLRERDGRTINTRFNGKLSGDTITGKVVSDYSGEDRTFDWLAKKSQ